MKHYKSRYNPIQILLYFIAAVGLMGALSIFTFSIYQNEVISKPIHSQIFFLLLACGLPGFVSLYSLRQMLINMPLIRLMKDRLEITNAKGIKTIYLNEIKHIVFTKVPFRYVFRVPIEGILLVDKNDNETYLYDLYYSNLFKLKWILSQLIDSKNNMISTNLDNIKEYQKDKINSSEIRFEKFVDYKGLWWVTMAGLIIIFFAILPFAITLLKGGTFKMPIPVYLGMVGFFYFLFGYQLHYFKISDKFLIVTNHVWIWRQKRFRLNNIQEIVFEQPDKLPVSMRIITNDFKSRLYPASSLRNKTWQELHKLIKDCNIKTRKETHF